jgi:sugar phosphate isomerase/epimerase
MKEIIFTDGTAPVVDHRISTVRKNRMAKITTISSIAYAHYTLYETLPRMAKRGFKQVEVGSFRGYCYHFNYGSPTPAELRGMLTDLDLKPIALNWAPVMSDSYNEASTRQWMEEYKRKIRDAQEVGFPMMTMAYGRPNEALSLEEQRKICTGLYRELAEYAQSCGMKMLLELPHLYLVHNDCEPVYALLNDLDLPNVGILVDSSHWGLIGYDIETYLKKLGDRLWHIHLRDSSPTPQTDRDWVFVRPALFGKKKYNLTLTPGLGSVDFSRLGKALDGIGYQGDVTTEFEYFDMPLDEIERQYDAGLAHMVQCGWELPDGVQYSGH